MKNIRDDLLYPELSYKIDQVLSYLKLSNKNLAILANFSRKGILFKRIVNIN